MAKNNNLTDFLTDTANAIRTKKGTTGKINPQNFSSEIASIQTGVDTSDATATADDILLGKTAYAKGEKLTGTIEIYAGEGGETVNKLAALVDGSLTEITAEDLAGANQIRNEAFKNCKYLISIIISEGVISIGNTAFFGCESLVNVVIPDSVTSIGSSTFLNCKKLTNTTMSNSLTRIGSSAFQGCEALTNIIIPNSVTSIEGSAFEDCKKITNIIIPDGILKISDYVFNRCVGLTSITIPNSVKTIESYAFNGCKALTSITIPNSVTNIGSSALYIGSSTNKATITMLPTTPPTIQSSTFTKSYLQKIIVPAGTGATYKAATNWSTFADYIEEAAE